MATEFEKVTLTIFTPTYNRAHLLPRLFESIRSQVSPEGLVEWLVIDDGSRDDTETLLAGFAGERPDLVRYICVENGGKHRAVNLAAGLARGDWIMFLDSDDRLVDGAIAEVLETIHQIDDDARIGLLRGLKRFPGSKTDHRFEARQNPCRHVDWISSQRPLETAEVIRRTALKLHRFPDFPGEGFMSEGWLYHRLDRTHLTFFINKPWMDCFYQSDGLSARSRRIRADSSCSALAVYTVMLESQLPLRWRMRYAINWWRYLFHAKKQNKSVRLESRAPVAFAPLGLVMFWNDLRGH